MTTPKINQKAMTALLEQINFHLKNNDLPNLEKTINGGDIAAILSNETLGLARAMRNSPLVLLLASLAVDSGVDAVTAERWRDSYLSIKEKRLVGQLDKLPARNILRQVVEVFIGTLAKEKINWGKAVGHDQEVTDAFELACDFLRWDIAESILTPRTQDARHLRACLSMANAIVKRHQSVRNEAVHRHFASFLEKIIHCGGALFSADVRTTLQTLMAASHQIAGHHSQALAIYQAIDPHQESLLACSEIARSHCKLGDIDQCIAYMDRSVALLLRNKSAQGKAKPLPLILQTPAEANYTVGRANQALRDLAALAQRAGQKLFPVSGTLLGYAREGDLLAHDKDVDLGILGHQGLLELVRLGLESKRFYISPDYLKGEDTVQVPFIHRPTGVWIDLFVYSEREGGLVTGVDFQFGYRQTFQFTPFDLVPIDFLGVALYAPSDIDLNLQENFGDWRHPDPSYISHLESPSTMHKGGREHLLTARMWIIKALQDGNFARLQKAMACLRDYAGNPGAASPDLLDALAAYLAQAQAQAPGRPPLIGQTARAPQPLAELAPH